MSNEASNKKLMVEKRDNKYQIQVHLVKIFERIIIKYKYTLTSQIAN